MIRRLSRREFVRSLAALAASPAMVFKPHSADAQQPASPRRIGVLLVIFSPQSKEAQAFRQGLRDAGYAEGRDVIIEWRYADGDYDRIPALVDDLVQQKVEVMVVETTLAAQTIKRATSTIPIVMSLVGDPIGAGLVASLPRPGANVTGLSSMTIPLSTKRLQLLKEAVPKVTRVTVLWNPETPWHRKVLEDLKAVAPSMSIELAFVGIRASEEIVPAFSAISRAQAEALQLIESPLFSKHRMTLLKLVSKARLPAMYPERQFADTGGLMSFGTNIGDLYRRSAGYVDKILKGAKPGDLPIEQPTRFEFVINLKTAKALGLKIPQSILLRADEVIR